MTLAAYRELGGVSGAARWSALRRSTKVSVTKSDHRHVRALHETRDAGRRGGRHPASRARRSELLALPVGPEAMEHVLGAFGSQRLLTFDRDPATREPTVEVGHEALLTEWPRLKAWVDEDREGLRVMRRVAEAGEAWVQGGREEADLLRGARLRRRRSGQGRTPSASRPTSETSLPLRPPRAMPPEPESGATLGDSTVSSRESAWPSRSSARRLPARSAVGQRNESTAQRNQARSQGALAASAARAGHRGSAERNHRTNGIPGQITRCVESLTGSAARGRGRSTAPRPRHPGFASRSRRSQIPRSSDRCTRPHC